MNSEIFNLYTAYYIHNVINLEEAKNKLLQSEKKRKLDMFALSHFNKIRKTIEVNYNF